MAIDRRAVVERHDVVLTGPDAQCPLTVGNGDFACTVDITGMQTFTAFHDPAQAGERLVTNTCTLTSWGWHEMPNPHGYTMADAMTTYESAAGPVEYPDQFDMLTMFGLEGDPALAAGTWLHVNPQRLDLGRIGLVLQPAADAAAEGDPGALSSISQRLHLWSGTVFSTFEYAGQPVSVTTAAHPEEPQVAFRIASPLLKSGLLRVRLAFPYAHDGFFETADWESPGRHHTLVEAGTDGARIVRTLDTTTYTVGIHWNRATLHTTPDPHTAEVIAAGDVLELSVRFSDGNHSPPIASAAQTLAAAEMWWESFWSTGAAIDFSGCRDPRAPELERRIVLSQYLTAVNCSGHLPPQETGLVQNSWNGKFHLEMHWWHAAHFPAWGRPELLERSLDWYRRILSSAQERARQQGFEGARWPKQVGPDGRDSPNEIGPLLVWQQPHILYFLELLHRNEARPGLVEEFAEIVEETARFMASFVTEQDGAFHLSAPLIPAQENYDRRSVVDPTFELAYWWWGLEIAQRWRERRGLDRDDRWTEVQAGLVCPHQTGGRYDAIGVEPFLLRQDHPSMLAALGFVPATPLVDPEVMEATLREVARTWDWDSAWGWDFPTMAMTAARVGAPAQAIDALLVDCSKNVCLPTGHNPQRGNRLPLYLPGNGGLLAAISLMAGGWDGSVGDAPGFPKDGTWDVSCEGFTPWP